MSRRYSAVILAVAVLFGALWLYAARDDRRLRFEEVPDGGPVTVLATTFRLESLQRIETVTDRYGAIWAPMPNAALIRATIGYDATAADVPPGLLCSAELVGAEGIWWYPESITPADLNRSAYCEAGRVGAMDVVFEVPAAMLGSVRGVNLSIYDGEPGGPQEPDRLLLAGVG